MKNGEEREPGRQQGAQTHAEGQHGDKTRARLLEELQSGNREPSPRAGHGHAYDPTASDGKHRLSEDREQHDEAERNSENERVTRDAEPSDGRG